MPADGPFCLNGLYCPQQIYSFAVESNDCEIDFRASQELGELRRQHLIQLGRRETRSLNVLNEGVGDAAVGTNFYLLDLGHVRQKRDFQDVGWSYKILWKTVNLGKRTEGGRKRRLLDLRNACISFCWGQPKFNARCPPTSVE